MESIISYRTVPVGSGCLPDLGKGNAPPLEQVLAHKMVPVVGFLVCDAPPTDVSVGKDMVGVLFVGRHARFRHEPRRGQMVPWKPGILPHRPAIKRNPVAVHSAVGIFEADVLFVESSPIAVPVLGFAPVAVDRGNSGNLGDFLISESPIPSSQGADRSFKRESSAVIPSHRHAIVPD